MSRPPARGIFSSDEYRRLKEAGVSIFTVSAWHHLRVIPHNKRKVEIASLLGRDPWSKDSKTPEAPLPVAPPQPVLPAVPRPHIEINPCVDDDVCLAVRKAAMLPMANTLLDSRRDIFCANCKLGIERARVEAANRKPTHGEGPRYCADPDCSRILSWGAKGDHCNIHKISRRRATV